MPDRPLPATAESFDGTWTNSSGEVVTIKEDLISWEASPAATLVRSGQDEFSVDLGSMGVFSARRDTQGRLVWSDGDMWTRADASATAASPRAEAMATAADPSESSVLAPDTQRLSTARASRERILAAGAWHAVLGVPSKASPEDLRRAYHELVLLHHPDKGLGGADDAEAFRLVQQAYEKGLREREQAAKEAAARTAAPPTVMVEKFVGLQVKGVAERSKKELRLAMDKWEHALDASTGEHIIDDFLPMNVEDVVKLLAEGRCVPVDVREESDKYGGLREPLPGAVEISYMSLTKSPERVAARIVKLQHRTDHGRDGRKVVCYSASGGSSGQCAAFACALADVFNFNAEALFTLEGGYKEWYTWRNRHAEEASRLPPAA